MCSLIKIGERESWSIDGAKALLGIPNSKKQSIVLDEVELERFVPTEERSTDTIRIDANNTTPNCAV